MAFDSSALRAAFPPLAEGRLCYLDWAATGLLPAVGRDDVVALARELAACEPGVSTWMHAAHARTREEVRALAAREIGAESDDVALVESTTAGLQVASAALAIEPGANVVLGANDYLAVAMPWKRRQESQALELRFVRPRGAGPTVDEVLDRVDERTAVVAMSSIAWTSGQLLDAETLGAELARRGVPFFLDAIQTFGVVPLEVSRIKPSIVAVGGHKWLGSALGAGFLYVAPDFAAQHPPRHAGFLSGEAPRGSWWSWFQDPRSSPEEEVTFVPCGRTFETGGTPSYPGALGLRAGISLLSRAGIAAIHEHVRRLGTELIEGLKQRRLEVVTPRDPRLRAGIVVVRIPGGAEAERALAARLGEAGIVVGVRYSGGVGGLRISLHGPNDETDVGRLLSALDRLGVAG